MNLLSILPVHILLLVASCLEAAECRSESDAQAPPSSEFQHLNFLGRRLFFSNYNNWRPRAEEDGRPTGGKEDTICHPAGACEPCPAEHMQEPFCQPFGNRRLLHCLSVSDPAAPDVQDHDLEPPVGHPGSKPPPSALPAWESCGRRVPKERGDFFEFVFSNLVFAGIALTGVLVRSERMRAVRARRLAARIGVGLRRASSGSLAALGGMSAALTQEDNEQRENGTVPEDEIPLRG